MARSRKTAVSQYKPLFYALAFSNGVSLILFLMRSAESMTDRYWFLLWNIFLGWVPLLFAWVLVRRLKETRWSSWQNVGLTLLWLGFLPNSFYLVSDLIHLQQTGEVSMLYDAVMFMSFIFNGFVFGFMSLYIVHTALIRRSSTRVATQVVGLVLLACSFAIYMGRSLRWNTWDVLMRPLDIFIDVSDRVIYPTQHPHSFITTTIFFLLLSSTYAVIWTTILAAKAQKK
jgi:uncharacterized membrane protein